MICEYGKPKFKELQAVLHKYLNEKSINENIDREKRKLASILNETISDNNTNRFIELDKLNLSFNSWSNETYAINDNLLASQNIILLKILHGNDPNTFVFEAVLEALYLALYADFYEASLIITDFHHKKFFEDIISKLNYYMEYLSSESLKTLNYLWFHTPKYIFEVHLKQNLSIKTLEDINKLQKNEEVVSDQIRTSEKLVEEIEEIRESLKKQKHAFNFVGLSDGFNNLKEQKQKELFTQNLIHYLLMLIILILIGVKSYWSINYLGDESFDNMVLIVTTVSTVLVVFIILYFFRISLVNIKSIKSQILQIDLRLTLCQFIHNYENDIVSSQ